MNDLEFGEKYYKLVGKYTVFQAIINVILTIGKIFGGIFASSSALLSDGIDSLGDSLTSLVSVIANKKASKKADKEHQYGHEKIENFITLLFSIFIILSGLILIYNAITSMINGSYKEDLSSFFIYAIIISSSAIFIKGILGIVVFIGYKKSKSPLLKAQSLDHFLDSIGTLLTLISLIIIYIFKDNEMVRILDPISSLIISFIILSGLIRIYINNTNSLINKAISKEMYEKIKNEILEVKGVLHIDLLKSRIASNRVFIDVEISVDDDLSLKEAHDIAENIKETIRKNNREVKSVLVHVNPYSHKDQETGIY